METISKSSELLSRLRSVSLEDDLKLSDFWPKEIPVAQNPFCSDLYSKQTVSSPSAWDRSNTESPVKEYKESDFQHEPEPVVVHQEKPVMEEVPVVVAPVSDSVENQENPFAKMSRNTPKPPLKFYEIKGWLASLSCFGILGFICGGSLMAWSILSGSGSHSLTALGLSLILSGFSMFVLVGFYQTTHLISGRN